MYLGAKVECSGKLHSSLVTPIHRHKEWEALHIFWVFTPVPEAHAAQQLRQGMGSQHLQLTPPTAHAKCMSWMRPLLPTLL